MATDALTLTDIDAYYGDSHVLQKVSFTLGEGRLLGLLGRNGAGKSTCMNVSRRPAAAAQRAKSAYSARRSASCRPSRSPRSALRWCRRGAASSAASPCARTWRSRRASRATVARRAWTTETVFAMFPRLEERHRQTAGYLSGGEQQMLAIGRALMNNPRVLLMDEPSEGLAPQIVAEVMATIRKLKESGLSIVLVEQNPNLVFDIADDVVILNTGQVAVVSTAAELDRDGNDLRQHLGVF